MTDSDSCGQLDSMNVRKTNVRRTIRIFAIFAVIIMVSTCFSMLIGAPAAADVGPLATVVDSDSSLTNASLSPAPLSDTTFLQSKPVPQFFGEANGGGVEVFGSAKSVTVSDTGPILTQPQLIRKGDALIFRTGFGTYVVNQSAPETLAILGEDDVTVVRESYFTVQYAGVVASLHDATVVTADNGSLVVEYNLTLPSSPSSPIGRMELRIDFSDCRPPKMTATVLQIDSLTKNWWVIWQIAIPDNPRFAFDGLDNQETPIANYANFNVPLHSLSAKIVSSPDNRTASILINWSDEQEGELSVVASPDLWGKGISHILRVSFEPGKRIIDPSLVATTTDPSGTRLSTQRKTFWYDGYYWIFYYSGSGIYYRTSGDGLSWSSETTVAFSTAIGFRTGFDVAQRDNYIAIGWLDTAKIVHFKRGIIHDRNIGWIWENPFSADIGSVSVAIGTDYTFWLSFLYLNYPPTSQNIQVWRFDSSSYPGSKILDRSRYGPMPSTPALEHFQILLPMTNGNMTLLEMSDTGSGAIKQSVYLQSYWSSLGGGYGWGSPRQVFIYADVGKAENFTAVGTSNGTIYMAYTVAPSVLAITVIWPNSLYTITEIEADPYYAKCPTLALDSTGRLHVFYMAYFSGAKRIMHSMKLSDDVTDWSTKDTVYSTTDSSIDFWGLSAWSSPLNTLTLGFTRTTSTTKNVLFLSIPLPYGTSGSSSDPWSREGISPYGTYFGSSGASISPGSGQLFLSQQDVSVPGRVGMNIGISRIYQQPRFFNNSDGSPYMALGYPFANMGRYWSLDLPWMDKTYIYTGSGMRFIIQWGNNGNTNEFENHDGVHFIMRKANIGGTSFIELVMPSGLRYRFDSNSPYKLLSITDLKGYNPLASTYTNPYNCLNLSYNASNRLVAIYESGMNRSILFGYNGNGLLSQITRPDGNKINFTYVSYNDVYYLSTASDPKGRITTYKYNSSANYLLRSIVYPTGANATYAYSKDNTSATEFFSWFATKDILKNSTGGALIRQTNIDYKIINGKVTFAKLTDFNESAGVAGYTEHIFYSTLKYSSESKKDSSGLQIYCKRTYYDSSGQPSRIDTLKGISQEVNYSEYVNFDDWGNAIFNRDALGNAVYSTYANTSTQNSFQGGDILTRSSSGKIFYDAFDDWDFSDWTVTMSGSNTATMDGITDPPHAPALKLYRASVGSTNCIVTKTISSQTSAFYMQFSFMTTTSNICYLLADSGSSNIRIYFSAQPGDGTGYFEYYTGSAYVKVAPCRTNVWYDVCFYARTNNTYDIFIDGSCVKKYAVMTTSGNINMVHFQAGTYGMDSSITMFVDNVRIYRNLTVSIGNMDSNYIAELYDGSGQLLNRSKTGNLTVLIPPLDAPPAFIRIWKIGDYSFTTPMMDVWGGDVYRFNPGLRSSNLQKYELGYAKWTGWLVNDTWPTGSTYYESWINEGTWESYPQIAVGAGTKYHESHYEPWDSSPVHWHGFNGSTSPMYVYQTNVLITYIWLTYGKVPKEIMLQFYVQGKWRRAYWGGNDTSKADMMGNLQTGFAPYVTVRMGEVPQVTGKWVELTALASDLGLTGWNNATGVSGVIYGLYGGTAMWDLTCRYSKGIYVYGVSSGMSVQLKLDNGTLISGTVAQGQTLLILDPIMNGVKAWPVSGYFKVFDSAGALLYASPHFIDMYNLDKFQWSAPSFYPNQIKALIHDRLAGTFRYQDKANTTSEESYVKYDFEGNAIESKSKLGSSWVYSQSGYDQYGNQLWSSDPTGRRAITEYSSSNCYTYPVSTGSGGRTDVFEFDTSWTASKSGTMSPDTYDAKYTTVESYSPTHSIQLNFSDGINSLSNCQAAMYKDYQVNPVATLSVRMYLDTYSHNHHRPDRMQSGIKMRLYDSDGVNYATYSYILTGWYGSQDNWTDYDPSWIVVYGKPTMGTWINPVLHPSTDWNINWTACDKVRFELYVYASATYGDEFRVYYDDFTYDDFATNSKTVFTYDLDTGNLLSSTDPLGHQTSIQYDVLGRAIRANNSDGTYRTITFDDENNKLTTLDELSHKTIQYFDTIGRLIKVERYNGSTYYSSVNSTYNWQDRQSAIQDAFGRVTKTTYDYLGRPIKIVNPDNTNRTVSYNDQANLVTFTDENGHRVVQVLDDVGRLNATREYYSASSYYETKMAYDAAGNLLTVRASNGNVTRMSYDSLNQVTQTTYPDDLNELMTYDQAGRVLTKINRNGQTAYSYCDSSGKLFRLKTLNDTISYLFDADGKTVKIKNSIATIYCFYNSRDLMSSMAENIISNHTISYTYDADGKLMNITYPNSIKITYGYDAFDRAIKIDKNASTRLLTVYYNKDDTVSKESTGSVQVTNYTYNTRGFVSQIQTKNGSKFVLSMNYTYDKVGNVRNISYTPGGGGNPASYENYTYDWLNRLVRAKGAGSYSWGSTITYGYDSMGNRLWKNENSINTTYSYGLYNKLVKNTTSGTDTTWFYNGNGALLWKNTTNSKFQYAFNSMDQLTDVYKWTYSGSWSRSLIASYYYDANGARAKTVEGSRTTEYVYSGHDSICDKLNGTYTDYVYFNGRLKVKMIGSDSYWYIDDIIGSTRLVYKGSVKVYSVTTYKPFGIAYGASGTEKFTFAGEMMDSPSGLFYLMARYYDPNIGRFISMDPLESSNTPQSLNRYVYCLNNPLIIVDKSGLYPLYFEDTGRMNYVASLSPEEALIAQNAWIAGGNGDISTKSIDVGDGARIDLVGNQDGFLLYEGEVITGATFCGFDQKTAIEAMHGMGYVCQESGYYNVNQIVALDYSVAAGASFPFIFLPLARGGIVPMGIGTSWGDVELEGRVYDLSIGEYVGESTFLDLGPIKADYQNGMKLYNINNEGVYLEANHVYSFRVNLMIQSTSLAFGVDASAGRVTVNAIYCGYEVGLG